MCRSARDDVVALVCREVQDSFHQVPQYKDADDLETLKGIQVGLTEHSSHGCSCMVKNLPC